MPTECPVLMIVCIPAIVFFGFLAGCHERSSESGVAAAPEQFTKRNDLPPPPLAAQGMEPITRQAPSPSSESRTEIIDLAADIRAGNMSQARRVRITRTADGSELERTFLDEAGNGLRTIRKTEDGLLEITRIFDAAGKTVREQTYLNGVIKSQSPRAEHGEKRLSP
ncbi:MAG: hypothetical protein JWL90_877 [Chthoniobacteraceae bacterium]|nr:hypothetical protein [Chthoniobacteraceae bacterium]